MQKAKFILMVTLAISFSAKAQDWSGKIYQFDKVYPGYVVKLTGDTIRGFVEHNRRYENQNKCIFFSDPADKKSKTVYKPDDIKGYSVGDKVYRSIRYSGGLFGKTLKFNLLLKEGHITQYMFYNKEEGFVLQVRNAGETDYDYDKRSSTEQPVYQKGDEQPFSHDKFALRWAKVMAELVADDTELAAKVSQKQEGYKFLNHYKVLDEYNAWYEKNHH